MHARKSVSGYAAQFVTGKDIDSFIFGRRKDVQCPKCGSLERHRLQKLVMDKIGIVELVKGEKILHFAPEKFFEKVFKKVADVYISADIQPGQGMIVADIIN